MAQYTQHHQKIEFVVYMLTS